MKALTVLQPWAWAIAGGWKRFENRTWKPALSELDTWIAIHAGKRKPEHQEARMVADLAGQPIIGEAFITGVIVCVAHLHSIYRFEEREGVKRIAPTHPMAPTGSFEMREEELKWAFGPYCFFFDRVVPVKHIPVSGALNLWRLPQAVDEELRAEWCL